MTKEYPALIGRAKTAIDNGFSRVGKKLDAASAADRALMLLASRAVAVANALVLLAQNSLANEAAPLLRSLLEIAAAMRWIAAENSEERAIEALEESETADWAGLWQTDRLLERMRASGFPRDLEDRVGLLCREHLRGNAQGLPWGHKFEHDKGKGISGEELLRIAALASGHAVKALDVRWPGNFEGAEQLWEKAK
ncbi:MAG: hypothetical protein HY077_05605 [Elusimicrobia bacterium]|nr:hypothetical protein [Elusimicrobiota bacterium]